MPKFKRNDRIYHHSGKFSFVIKKIKNGRYIVEWKGNSLKFSYDVKDIDENTQTINGIHYLNNPFVECTKKN